MIKYIMAQVYVSKFSDADESTATSAAASTTQNNQASNASDMAKEPPRHTSFML